eukprot:XP_011669139.1 PREDICTED: uncharacterized protein LOC105440536 [Strongylocentrotus purpuratus]
MKVSIISCLTCMFAVALTMGGQIRRQAAQSEKTVTIGGNVTLLCPLPPDDTWIWVYWKKNDVTVYSLEVISNTPTTNDTRYEVSNNATRLTIKDLKKTDSGIYHCKVATLRFIKERGKVLLSVTDQEVGLSTASPGIPFRASTTIPPQPAKDNTPFVVFAILTFILSIISIILSTLTRRHVLKQQERDKKLQKVLESPSKKLEDAGTVTDLLGIDDVDLVDGLEKNIKCLLCIGKYTLIKCIS